MNNKEYIAELARQTGYSQEDAQKLVRKVIDAMISQFEEGEAVAIPNFGTFEVKKRMERMQKEYQKLKTGTKSLGDIAADFTQDDKKREEAKEKTKKGFDFLKGKTKKVLEGK